MSYYLLHCISDINECLNTSTHNCSEADNEECLNFEGYYVCHCQAGFERIETSQTCEGGIIKN